MSNGELLVRAGASVPLLALRRRLFWISPPGIALASLLLCVAAVLFPPTYYEQLIGERNRVFMSPYVLLYFGGSLVALLAGYWALNHLMQPRTHPQPLQRSGNYLPLLLFSGGLGAYAIYDALAKNVSLIEWLLSLSGNMIKENFEASSGINAINFVLMGVAWWSVWLWKEPGARWLKLAAFGLTLLVIVNGLIKLSRGEVMPILFGLAVSYAGVTAVRNPEMRIGVRQVGVMLILIVLVFLLFSMVRGGGDKLASDLVGYLLSSFNRLAFLIDGDLVYLDAGTGIYSVSFLGYNNILNGLLGTREFLDWPDFNTYWEAEFGAVWSAGLNGYLIWATAPGYILSEMGPYMFIYWFVIGLAYAYSWASFCNQEVLGRVLYPWFAFCLFFWFGTNYLFDTRVVALILALLLIRGYEVLTQPDSRAAARLARTMDSPF